MAHSNRKSRRSASASSRARKGAKGRKMAAVVLAPVVVLGLGAAAMTGYINQEKPDANYCYTRDKQHKVAVFVDSSLRQQSPAQLRDYETALDRAYKSAPINAQISFYTTASDTNRSLAEPVFTICKPASNPAEQAEIGAPEKSAPYLKRQADEVVALYAKEVDKILADVQDHEKMASDSPILSQIRAISFNDEFVGQTRSFTILSDGLENSEIAQFGQVKGDMPSFEKFKERADYNLKIKPRSFAGTDVTLLLVEHGKLPAPGLEYVSTNELQGWWVSYFEENDADYVEMTPLRYWVGAR